MFLPIVYSEGPKTRDLGSDVSISLGANERRDQL